MRPEMPLPGAPPPPKSDFEIQVVHIPTGQVLSWAPGKQEERDLITSLVTRVLEKKVGVFRTKAAVALAVTEAFKELLLALKKQV